MRKITLPLVMIASLATLVSCGEKPAVVPAPVMKVENTAVTGVVVTPTAPVVITRKETLSYDSKSPEGMVPVEFDVTVTDGIITAAAATPKTDKQASLYNQTNFAKDLSAKVVGKKAKDLKVDAIGGASLTTAAFETFVHSF